MATLTERVNNLEVTLGKTDTTLTHLSDEIKENTTALHAIEEGQKRQELLIQELSQSKKNDKKLLAVLMTFLGGLVGYIIKLLLS